MNLGTCNTVMMGNKVIFVTERKSTVSLCHKMLICTKPPWISHLDDKQKRSCIYSIALHPQRPILATGGLDNKIRIWNMDPVLQEAKENDDRIHRLLSTLTLHNGAVLCVRFSQMEGRYLASSSDGDNVIMIWEKETHAAADSYRSRVFGSSSGEVNVESWRCVKRMAAHHSDVVDLAWSPDNALFASCGLDGSIIIWDTEEFNQVKRLSAHGGFVKGITWDPVGKYLASQSDDRSLIIWNIENWTVEKKVLDRFEKSMGQTFFKRLSWSPDGSQICAVHAVDQSQLISTASIVNREKWEEEACLIGHHGVIECSAYSPVLYRKDENSEPFCVCAIGSQDGTISFWMSCSARAPLVSQNLFNGPVFDICWDSTGHTVLACSSDGTIAAFQFDDKAFGEPICPEDLHSLLSKYGYRGPGRDRLIPENPSQILMEAAPKPNSSSNPFAMANGQSSSSLFKNESNGSAAISAIIQSSPSKLQHQAFNSVFEGKRRVQPVSVDTTRNNSSGTQSDILRTQQTTTTASGKRRVQPVMLQSSPPRVTPSTVTKRDTAALEGIHPDVTGVSEAQLEKAIQLANVPITLPSYPSKNTMIVEGDGCTFTVDNQGNFGKTKFSRISRKSGSHNVWVDYLPSPVLAMVHSDPYLVATCQDNSIVAWHAKSGRRILPRMYLDGLASHVCLTAPMLLIITHRGSLWVWDIKEHCCLLERISIAPALLPNHTDTKRPPRKILHCHLTAAGIPMLTLDHHETVFFHPRMRTWARATSSTDMDQLSDWYMERKAVLLGELAEPRTSKRVRLFDSRETPLAASQGSHTAAQLLTSLSTRPNKEIQRCITLSDLEDQLCVAVAMENANAYQQILQQYAQTLADIGEPMENKVQELLADLAKKSQGKASDDSSFTLLQLDWSNLLKRILPILAQNRCFQRILKPYHGHIHNITNKEQSNQGLLQSLL